MKKFILLLIIVTIIFAQFPLSLYAEEPATDYPTDYDPHLYQSASVLVMCAETGEIFYETEGFALRYPASITKVMTALLVLEYVENLDERVVFSYHALDIPYYASRMWMHEGESITVLEALYGIMLPSGNEVARALAEHVSGSVAAFVSRMNERAAELGAINTHFVNACGLPGDGQHVTAYDVALIMQSAIQHPIFVEIIATPYFELPPTSHYGNARPLRNTNRMIRPGEPEYNPNVIGGKTGFTNAAQHTLVSYVRQGDVGLIITVMYAPRGATFTDTAALMDYVFAMLAEREAKAAPEPEIEAIEAVQIDEPVLEIAYDDVTDEIFEENDAPYYEEISDRKVVMVVSVSLVTVILGLLAVNMYYRRRRKNKYG